MFKANRYVFLVAIFVHVSHSNNLQTTLESETLSPIDHSPMKYNGTGFRNPKYLFVSHKGALHPVINETTVAVSAGYLTLIGLGFVSVINAAAKQLNTKSSSSTTSKPIIIQNNTASDDSKTKNRTKRKRPFSYTFTTTLSPLETYDDVDIDFDDMVDDGNNSEYEEELRQYEKDYEQYLKDYAEWNKTYGDLYRNSADSASVMVDTSSERDSDYFRLSSNTIKRKQR